MIVLFFKLGNEEGRAAWGREQEVIMSSVFNMLSVSFLWDIWVIDRYMRYMDLDINKEV